MLMTILIVLLVLMLFGAFPAWPHAQQWGPYPFGGILVILIILVVLHYGGRF